MEAVFGNKGDSHKIVKSASAASAFGEPKVEQDSRPPRRFLGVNENALHHRFNYKTVCMSYHGTNTFDPHHEILLALHDRPVSILSLYVGMVINKNSDPFNFVNIQNGSFRQDTYRLIETFIASGDSIIDPKNKSDAVRKESTSRKRMSRYDSLSDETLHSFLEMFQKKRTGLDDVQVERSKISRGDMIESILKHFEAKMNLLSATDEPKTSEKSK